MARPRTQVEYWLMQLYRADVLKQRGIDRGTVVRVARDYLASSDESREEVARKIAELEPVVRRRGDVSAQAEKRQLEYLRLLQEERVDG